MIKCILVTDAGGYIRKSLSVQINKSLERTFAQ